MMIQTRAQTQTQTQAQLSSLATRLYSHFRLCHPARGLTPVEARAFRLWQSVVRVRAAREARLGPRAGAGVLASRAERGWREYLERERAVLTGLISHTEGEQITN
jgi:hypothetical protein